MIKKPSAGETVRKALWLILAAVILAVVVNLVHPKRIPWIGDWANRIEAQAVTEKVALVQLSDMLKYLRDDSRMFVDARLSEEYAKAHFPGAVSLPFQTLETQSAIVTQVLTSDKPPVVYCTGPECDDSLLLALELRKLGREDVAVFVGGMELWQSELLSTEGASAQ
jgi:rhodanese-related sulfurtransferase